MGSQKQIEVMVPVIDVEIPGLSLREVSKGFDGITPGLKELLILQQKLTFGYWG